MKVSRGWLLAFGIVAAGLVGFAGVLLVDAGAFKSLKPHFAGSCRAFKGIVGAEDMEAVGSQQLLVISADNRPEDLGTETPSGALYTLDLRDASAVPVRLTAPTLPFEFHPHGLAVRELPSGPRVWVVNHRKGESTIEVFDLRVNAAGVRGAEHVQTLRDPLLMNANDIVAMNDEGHLFVTHDHGSKSHFMKMAEAYSRIGRGYVTYFDGTAFSVKAKGIAFANGVVATDGGMRLAVASMLGRKILLFKVGSGGDLTRDGEIKLTTSPDNLMMDAKGDLWIGAHPKVLGLKAHSKNHKRPAPAQILRVKAPWSQAADSSAVKPVIEEVFLDDGSLISAVSVVFPMSTESGATRLVLGSIYDTKVLDCVSDSSSKVHSADSDANMSARVHSR